MGTIGKYKIRLLVVMERLTGEEGQLAPYPTCIRLGGKIIWIDLELKSYSEEILPEYGWGVGPQS